MRSKPFLTLPPLGVKGRRSQLNALLPSKSEATSEVGMSRSVWSALQYRARAECALLRAMGRHDQARKWEHDLAIAKSAHIREQRDRQDAWLAAHPPVADDQVEHDTADGMAPEDPEITRQWLQAGAHLQGPGTYDTTQRPEVGVAQFVGGQDAISRAASSASDVPPTPYQTAPTATPPSQRAPPVPSNLDFHSLPPSPPTGAVTWHYPDFTLDGPILVDSLEPLPPVNVKELVFEALTALFPAVSDSPWIPTPWLSLQLKVSVETLDAALEDLTRERTCAVVAGYVRTTVGVRSVERLPRPTGSRPKDLLAVIEALGDRVTDMEGHHDWVPHSVVQACCAKVLPYPQAELQLASDVLQNINYIEVRADKVKALVSDTDDRVKATEVLDSFFWHG